ncbi:Multicopper oxidase [Acidisarcina polymorpha]|uniref:Multicopper oxidase n=1 Tax=Acidisarcina polymorpha TaxID=2211140 RepID=A0A2Z5G2P1_9BACT|nr:multicopper oxidase family protein [Acidisarcina polymorpha]AXC12947.1 Multicopper oxidase [Acidisarcina polymorpha]
MFSRRDFLKLSGVAAAASGLPLCAHPLSAADYTLDIAPYSLQISAKHSVKTTAYNQQVPGPLLRFKEGQPVTIEVTNQTGSEEVVHWHGLFLPPDVDGAMEEGTNPIPAGANARYTFTPRPAGFRWYHTHVFAGNDLKKGQYTGQHGFLLIEPRENPARYDREFFLALHDWDGQMLSSGDGSMNPAYNFSTINGKMLGFSEPLRAKQGERVLLHILNSSPTDAHWLALPGHEFQVIALDGNPVPKTQTVSMLRLAPAERVCALVEMKNPGIWVLGEVRKHIQSAGMGIVVEYSGSSGKPIWQQPHSLDWNYGQFSAPVSSSATGEQLIEVPLIFESKFAGHGAPDHWMINGKPFPNTDTLTLHQGQRYRLQFINRSNDDHPVHLHRHSFEVRSLPGNGPGSDAKVRGIIKDVILVDAQSRVDVEFTANNPGMTLFHCHQQNHMDLGFMMLFRYA